MYLEKFGLSARPFALAPDADLMVWTSGLRRIRDRVRTAIADHVPLVVLTGPVGAGKTTFLFALIADEIDPATHVVFLRRTIYDANDLLQSVATDLPEVALDLPAADRIVAAARRRPLLVILDEAQGAPPDGVMALCRLAGEQERMTVLIAGQPELGPRLDGPDYRGLSVPTVHRHVLSPLTEEEAQTYIAGRLEQAGAREDLIDPGARAVIARAAGRIPRKINKVAEACLFMAVIEERNGVDAAFARQVIAKDLDPVTLALSPMQDHSPVSDYRPAGDRTVPPLPVPAAPEPNQVDPTDPGETPTSVLDSPPALVPSAAPAPEPSVPKPSRRQRSWSASAVLTLSAVALVVLTVTAIVTGTVGDAPRSDGAVASLRADPPKPAELARPGGLHSPAVPSGTAMPANAAFRDPALDVARPGRGRGPAPMGSAPILPREGLESATVSERDLARLYDRALSADDPRAAAIDYARAAVLGHARSAIYIGQKYDTGDGVLFSPEMAARWYAVADGADPAAIAVGDGPAQANPLRGIRLEDRVDLVWDGIAPVFDIELADGEGATIGDFRTALTAASLLAGDAAVSWRVRALGAGAFSDWLPIEPEAP